MKNRLKYLLVILIPFVFLIVVNSFSSPPTYSYVEDKCSRYCHNQGCPHFEKKLKDGKNRLLSEPAFRFYQWNISALKNNFLGISYRDMNLLLYVIFLPLLMVLLAYTGFKKVT